MWPFCFISWYEMLFINRPHLFAVFKPSSSMILFSTLFETLFLSVFNMFCPCAVSLLCSLICGLSFILCLYLFIFQLSFSGDENHACFIFFFRGRWIFQFWIFSLFMCSLVFSSPFDVSVDSLSFRLDELTDADACTCAHTTSTHTLTLSFYTRDQRHPHASVHSPLFVSLFHAPLHPHHSPYNS